MGGPAGASVYFGMNSTNLFSKAMLATDRSNTPRDYGKIISNARSSEEGLRKSLTAVDSYYPALRGEAAQQLFSQNVPAWRETDPPEGAEREGGSAEGGTGMSLPRTRRRVRAERDSLAKAPPVHVLRSVYWPFCQRNAC